MDEANKEWNASVKLNPENDEGGGGLGIALFASGNVKAAVSVYEKAIEINKNFVSPDWLRKNRSRTGKALLSVRKILSLLRKKPRIDK